MKIEFFIGKEKWCDRGEVPVIGETICVVRDYIPKNYRVTNVAKVLKITLDQLERFTVVEYVAAVTLSCE